MDELKFIDLPDELAEDIEAMLPKYIVGLDGEHTLQKVLTLLCVTGESAGAAGAYDVENKCEILHNIIEKFIKDNSEEGCE